MPPSRSERPLPRYQEGQVFSGYAFGQPITVTLDYPEWVDYAGPDEFWSWHIKTHLGGGGMLSERVIAGEFEAVSS